MTGNAAGSHAAQCKLHIAVEGLKKRREYRESTMIETYVSITIATKLIPIIFAAVNLVLKQTTVQNPLKIFRRWTSIWREIFCLSLSVSLLLTCCFFVLILFLKGSLRISVPLPPDLVPLH